MKRTRHYPPSQIKYQIEHPPVTVHLNKKLKEILDAVKGQRSYAQVIIDLIGEKFNIVEEIKRLPQNEAVISYARGFEEAEKRYAQFGTCIKCKGEDNHLWTDGKCDKCHGRTEGPDFSHFRDKIPITWIDEGDFEKAKIKLPNLEKLSYENGYKRGFEGGKDAGYMLGYDEAEEEFKITYPCSVCGKQLVMRPGDKDHIAMKGYMREHGWEHSSCGNKT
jgi:ssDNA-binding Zn-finger/Zn-ribbon topoisomerase 1